MSAKMKLFLMFVISYQLFFTLFEIKTETYQNFDYRCSPLQKHRLICSYNVKNTMSYKAYSEIICTEALSGFLPFATRLVRCQSVRQYDATTRFVNNVNPISTRCRCYVYWLSSTKLSIISRISAFQLKQYVYLCMYE